MATAKRVRRGRPKYGKARTIRVPIGMVACYADDGRLIVCIPADEWQRNIVPIIAAPAALPIASQGT